GRDVVAVIGNVTIGSRAEVGGDAVAFGGTLDIADDARIGGKLQEVDFGRRGLPSLIWLQTWVKQCVLKLRPLAPQVGWVWVVWGMFLLLYLLVAIAFPRPVAACVDELTHRPATTFAIGLLAKLLLPFVLFLLLVTGIGVFVIPFIWIALVLAGIVGKAALLEYFGKQLGRGTGLRVLEKPVLAFIAGAIIITLLYMVPVLGVIVLGLTGMWALGAAILALFTGLRREVPAQPAWPGAQGASSPPQPQVSVQQTGVTGPDVPGAAAGPAQAAQAASAGVTPPQMIVPEALQYPRAGFWARLGAAFLDVVLVGVISGIAGAGAFGWLIALAYFTGMWTWRGTTVGGVLLNLKVVRLDGRPVTFAVAFVRALAAAFSVIVFFLGFLWIAWDREKQAWHDKIVGTVVVRLPRSQPLLSI
ncbi:MAG: RDD family protein, partial [Verrucomicrobiae bacterium]|nr:RDD family protein [Verrucomicrobiae bacterium]